MSANIEQEQPRSAQAPFDNPAADIVLRSSDTMDFRVRSAIVAEASEIFAGMFASPQPPRGASGVDDNADYVGDTPVVQLAEDAKTLDDLLRLCYPVQDPVVEDAQQLGRVLAAALKYAMEEAVAVMRAQLRALIRTNPFEGWVVACTFKLEEDAWRAAFTLCSAVRPFDNKAAALSRVSAGQYFRLRIFVDCNGTVGPTYTFAEPKHWDTGVNAPSPARPQASVPTRRSAVHFQTRPFADVVCRASDGEEFLSHRVYLAAASTVLRDRLLALAAEEPGPDTQTPSTAAGAHPQLPVFEFADTAGATLSVLLELCYPVRRGTLSPRSLGPLRDVCALVRAAEKYAIGGLLPFLHSVFLAQVPAAPLAAYLLASHAGLPATLVHHAEQRILRDARPPSAHGWFPEMEGMPASAYHSLVVKHERIKRPGLSEHVSCGPSAPCKRRRTGGD
ncbi:hypothetical protein TRAPUB_12592 [Trametes pubescens]|uniref:BTB domain-containing protein n=1 Tax=Trametes pubescens TaxID=154538 RepID=A0A1M2VTL6_TRAPU|nr:hypothetical protein TRAPUB_12592 [Trametes pubescens]